MRANGVSLVANDTMRELEIMMPTGLAMPAVRGRTQYGDHGYDNREQESGEQFNPQFRTPQGCDGRHQYAVEHIAGDAEERTAAGGGVTVGDEPLHAMNLVDLLHLEELACFGVGLHLEDEIVKAGSRYAGHGAFSGGHGQREPDETGPPRVQE